jgi:hypothetical protein
MPAITRAGFVLPEKNLKIENQGKSQNGSLDKEPGIMKKTRNYRKIPSHTKIPATLRS